MCSIQNSPTLTNREMASMLFKIATLLRDREDNPYRIQAYLNGARYLMQGRMSDRVMPLKEAAKALPHPKGIFGDRLQSKLQELARTGEMSYFEDLCADLPPYMAALLHVPGVGPRTAQRLYDTLGIETAEQLQQAARAGQVQDVWGIGPKRQAQFAQLSLFDEEEVIQPLKMAA